MPSLVYIQDGRAMCRKHGDVGSAAQYKDHINAEHAWLNAPEPAETEADACASPVKVVG